MKTIVKYDLLYWQRTSKFIVLGALGLFLSGLSVLTARYFNYIIEFALRSEGIDIEMPEPTVLESYTQFFSNFNQIFLWVVLFVAVAFFTRDRTRGHLPLLFSKPLSRIHFILSKSLLISLTVLVTLLASAVVFGYYTYFLFDTFALGRFLLALLGFYAFVLMIVHTGLLVSAASKSYWVPALSALGLYFVASLLTILDFGVLKYMPWHLAAYPLVYAHGQLDTSVLLWATALAFALSAVMVLLSLRLFKSRPIV
ncbi:MAG: hypothetical protein EA374_05370 [Acholeplasmatales bacterium]|nr:MAG: hypothetical protein EA374_05370 [Acholeplasmatales bacterium]